MLLLSYSASVGVWNYFASQEAKRGNPNDMFIVLFHQIGCIALMFYVYHHFLFYVYRHHLDPYEMAIWYGTPMVIPLVKQVAVAANSILSGALETQLRLGTEA